MANDIHTSQLLARPNPDLKPFDRLVGTWRVSGGVRGKVSYEWMRGGFFLMQHVDFEHDGRNIRGIEVIGHELNFGEAPGEDVRSRFYSFADGLTLDYVYELDGDTLTIWGGEKGSAAYYRGTFGAGGDTLTGGWVYPGGGGYTSTATKVKEAERFGKLAFP